jgi:hypothetical protein
MMADPATLVMLACARAVWRGGGDGTAITFFLALPPPDAAADFAALVFSAAILGLYY